MEKLGSGKDVYAHFEITGTDLEKHQKVIIRQDANCCDLKCCGDWGICPRHHNFHVLDTNGKELVVCEEHRPCCYACCGLCQRETRVRVTQHKNIVARMTRPCQVCSCWQICECCRPRLFVTEGNTETQIGKVTSDWQLCCTCLPSFSVYDHKDWEKWHVRKEIQCCQKLFCYCCCPTCCPRKESFVIKNLDKDRVGSIAKRPELRSLYSDADTYMISFPPESTAAQRLVLIGASLLIDLSLFHEEPVENSERQRMMD